MKHIKLFENFDLNTNQNLEQQCKDLLINNEIIINDDYFDDKQKIRVKTDTFKFKPMDCKISMDTLKVYVPFNSIEGELKNPFRKYFDDTMVYDEIISQIIKNKLLGILPDYIKVEVTTKKLD
jgi:hypothetical protein